MLKTLKSMALWFNLLVKDGSFLKEPDMNRLQGSFKHAIYVIFLCVYSLFTAC